MLRLTGENTILNWKHNTKFSQLRSYQTFSAFKHVKTNWEEYNFKLKMQYQAINQVKNWQYQLMISS